MLVSSTHLKIFSNIDCLFSWHTLHLKDIICHPLKFGIIVTISFSAINSTSEGSITKFCEGLEEIQNVINFNAMRGYLLTTLFISISKGKQKAKNSLVHGLRLECLVFCIVLWTVAYSCFSFKVPLWWAVMWMWAVFFLRHLLSCCLSFAIENYL